MVAVHLLTSWNPARALTGGTRNAVPARELYIGELRHVAVLHVALLRLPVGRQRILAFVFVLGQE